MLELIADVGTVNPYDLADHLIGANETEIAAVDTVVAVIAHHIVMSCRDFTAELFIRINTPVDQGSVRRFGTRFQRPAVTFFVCQGVELHAVEPVSVTPPEMGTLRIHEIGELADTGILPVHDQMAIAVHHAVSRQSHHALDIRLIRLERPVEYDEVAALECGRMRQAGEMQAEGADVAITDLLDQDAIAYADGWQHRRRR